MKLNKKQNLALLIVIVIVVFFLFKKDVMLKKKLAINGIMTNAIVDSTNEGYKTGTYVIYHFFLKEKMYTNETKIFLNYKYHTLLLNRSFPLIYLPENPDKNSILILPEDFKYYRLAFPDSLNWILEYK
jgi:hypothetical protein